jgi:sugar phosphate permease
MNQLQLQYPSISFTHFVLPILYFYFGFMSFVPHMMIGLYSREIFPLLPSTAASFIKLIAQIGAGFAGYPTSLIVSQYGWEGVGICWGISGICALFFLLLVGYEFNSKNTSQNISQNISLSTTIKQKAD